MTDVTWVNAALAVSGSPPAKTATQRYDCLTLEQAAVLAESYDDPDTVKALVAAATSAGRAARAGARRSGPRRGSTPRSCGAPCPLPAGSGRSSCAASPGRPGWPLTPPTTDEGPAITHLEAMCYRRAGFRRSWWQPAVGAAGLEPLKVHELRHTFVSLWASAGVDLYEISVRAGHSSAAFAQDRYRHLYEDADDRLADRLDALLDRLAPDHDATVRRLSP